MQGDKFRLKLFFSRTFFGGHKSGQGLLHRRRHHTTAIFVVQRAFNFLLPNLLQPSFISHLLIYDTQVLLQGTNFANPLYHEPEQHGVSDEKKGLLQAAEDFSSGDHPLSDPLA